MSRCRGLWPSASALTAASPTVSAPAWLGHARACRCDHHLQTAGNEHARCVNAVTVALAPAWSPLGASVKMDNQHCLLQLLPPPLGSLHCQAGATHGDGVCLCGRSLFRRHRWLMTEFTVAQEGQEATRDWQPGARSVQRCAALLALLGSDADQLAGSAGTLRTTRLTRHAVLSRSRSAVCCVLQYPVAGCRAVAEPEARLFHHRVLQRT